MLNFIGNEQRTATALTWIFIGLLVILPVFPIRGFSGTLAGHLIGIAGTVLMLLTLVYPYRKRIQNLKGRRNPIMLHIFYGLTGSSLVVIHAEHHYGSLTGLLVYLAMFFVVLSGIVGRYLFKQVARTLREQKKDLSVLKHAFNERREKVPSNELREYLAPGGLWKFGRKNSVSDEEEGLGMQKACQEVVDFAELIADTEYTIASFDKTKSLFSRWIRYHIYLAVFMFSLIAVHSLATLYYGWKWLP